MKLKILFKFVDGDTFLVQKEDGSFVKVPQKEIYGICPFVQPGDYVTLEQIAPAITVVGSDVIHSPSRNRFIFDTEDGIVVPQGKKRGRPKLPDSLKKKYVPTGRPRGRPKKLKQLTWEQHNG